MVAERAEEAEEAAVAAVVEVGRGRGMKMKKEKWSVKKDVERAPQQQKPTSGHGSGESGGSGRIFFCTL